MKSARRIASNRHFHLSLKARVLLILTAALLLFSSLLGCESEGTRADYLASHGLTEPPATTQAPKPLKKRVALTFDDGPNYINTPKVLDALAQYGWSATFFVVGNRIDGQTSATLQRMVAEGHEIGIHGYSHTQNAEHYYDTCTDSVYQMEISNTVAAIRTYVPNYTPTLMRPVGGKISVERVAASPYSIIMWSVDTEDWDNRYYKGISDEEANHRVDTIVQNALANVKDGDIILMHDIYESTADATVKILAALYEMGYEVVTVSELLGDTMQPGRIYTEGMPIG